MIIVQRQVRFLRRRQARELVLQPKSAKSVPLGRVPRLARLMALAIRFDQLINEGMIPDLSELARWAHVSQPRMTQILGLTLLAPDIQEQLLFLPRLTTGRDLLHEKTLRPLTQVLDWTAQRKLWNQLSLLPYLRSMSCPPAHLGQAS